MDPHILGIHHVTAIAGDPQQNLDFYTRILGLRLVKLTVNFDDPGTYHLYFGDEVGRPGTIMTFFPWPGGAPGRRGPGQADTVSFSIAQPSLGFWMERLGSMDIRYEGPIPRFDEKVIILVDPDGLPIELVAAPGGRVTQREETPDIPREHGVQGFHGVTLVESDGRTTDSFLRETLGLSLVETEGTRRRYGAAEGAHGRFVDVIVRPHAASGLVAVGTIHHVAWRTPDVAEQLHWQKKIRTAGTHVTPVIDRTYFNSIYFREPGGVLFEIATDPPGFAADEEPGALGTRLMLPSWMEEQRQAIVRRLPRLALPAVQRAA
jgi:glyoxalase family protein